MVVEQGLDFSKDSQEQGAIDLKGTADNSVYSQNASFQGEIKETLLLDVQADKKVVVCLR
jgi:hypothetical protein